MEKYEKAETLGEGQFGVVFKAKHKETGQIVAIKKIRLGKAKEGVNMTALREVKLLRELQSPHIVRLVDVFAHKNNLALVFDFMESDLEMVIKNRATVLSPADIKAYMRMLLQALESVHAKWVLHRDIKPNNFLISSTGEMKLADFGLARAFGSPGRKYTNQVIAEPVVLGRRFCTSSCLWKKLGAGVCTVVPPSRAALWEQFIQPKSGYMGCRLLLWRATSPEAMDAWRYRHRAAQPDFPESRNSN